MTPNRPVPLGRVRAVRRAAESPAGGRRTRGMVRPSRRRPEPRGGAEHQARPGADQARSVGRGSRSARVTNGAPMRIAAVGVWAALHDYTFDQAPPGTVHAACIPTHNTSVAIAGSAAVAAAVWSGIRGLEWNATVDTACGQPTGVPNSAPGLCAVHLGSYPVGLRACGVVLRRGGNGHRVGDAIGMGRPRRVGAGRLRGRLLQLAAIRRVPFQSRETHEGTPTRLPRWPVRSRVRSTGPVASPKDWRTLIAKVNGLDVPAWVRLVDAIGNQARY